MTQVGAGNSWMQCKQTNKNEDKEDKSIQKYPTNHKSGSRRMGYSQLKSFFTTEETVTRMKRAHKG